jgi:tRNA(Ile2) C34 agmatinyltransferase TiaS
MMGKWDDWKNRNDPKVNDDVCPKCGVAMNSVGDDSYCPSCNPELDALADRIRSEY